MVRLVIIFLMAFCIRIAAWNYFGDYAKRTVYTDCIEYYNNSINLTPDPHYAKMWNYTQWYQRTPGYVLFLHLIQRSIIIQLLISGLACAVMFKLNKFAGWIWVFYPQDIICSFNYIKEALLLPLVIFAIYLLRKKRWWLVIVIPCLILPFVSYSGVIDSNASMSHLLAFNIWHLWQPPFNYTLVYSPMLVNLIFLPYIIMLIVWIHNIRGNNTKKGIFNKIYYGEGFVELTIAVILTLGFCWSPGEPRYKEPFMPLLVLFFANYIMEYRTAIKLKNKKILGKKK